MFFQKDNYRDPINANARTMKPDLTKCEIIITCLKTPCTNLADLLRSKRRNVPRRPLYLQMTDSSQLLCVPQLIVV